MQREVIESHQVDDFGIFRRVPEMFPVCRTEHPDIIVMKACGDFGYRPIRVTQIAALGGRVLCADLAPLWPNKRSGQALG